MLNFGGNEWVSSINSESLHLLCLKPAFFSFQTFPLLSDFELALLVLAMDSLNTEIKSNVFGKKKKNPERDKTIPFTKLVILTVMLRMKLVCVMDITPAQY